MEHVYYVTIKKVLDESDVVMVPKFDADTRKRHVFNRKVRVDASLLGSQSIRGSTQDEGQPA
jgi:hypothetical protein